MERYVEFISANYIWFIIISMVLLFALIGYFVENTGKLEKRVKKMKKVVEEPIPGVNVNDIPKVPLNEAALKNNKNLKDGEIKPVEPTDSKPVEQAPIPKATVNEVVNKNDAKFDEPLIIEEESEKKFNA